MRSNLLPNGSGISSHAAYPAGATLLPAPAGTLMPGERRGGWTFRGNGGPAAVTLGNAANKPSGYAICKISDELKFVSGVGDPATDNRALERHRARCGREFRGHQIWIVCDVEGPAAQILSPVARGGQRVVIRSNRLCKAGLADTHSHGGSFSRLRPWQVEDASGSFESVRKAFGEVRNE